MRQHRAYKEDHDKEKVLVPVSNFLSNRIIFRVAVSAPGGDDMNHPAERSGWANPRKTGQNQPENSDNDSPVINLSQARQ